MVNQPNEPGNQATHRGLADQFRTSGARRAVEQTYSPPPPPRDPQDEEYADYGDGDVKTSSVRLPKAIQAKLVAHRETSGMTNGEVFIVAIEATHLKLAELLFPGGRIGGGIFAARGIREKASRDEDGSQVTFRLRETDFDVIDDLKTRFGAASRAHLIAAALKGYFDDLDAGE